MANLDGYVRPAAIVAVLAASRRRPPFNATTGHRYERRVAARMRLKTVAAAAVAAAGVAWLAMPAVSSASTANSAIPRYQHVIEIMMENTSYSTIIGNPL